MTIRVLVVDDSVTVRKRLIEILESDPEFAVVGEAGDGKRAIELCQQLRPDVITLDMILPVMSGLAATEYIMAYFPTPILIVSSSTNRGELFRTYEALAAGAVDVLDKTPVEEGSDDWEQRLRGTLKIVARVRVITHPRGRLEKPGSVSRSSPPGAPEPGPHRVVAVGASTGGPGALVEVLRCMDDRVKIPVLVVIHLSDRFGAAFADWLNGESGLPVAYARSDIRIDETCGQVTLAPPGSHLVVRGRRLLLTSDPERHSCRPSVDVLFESVADEYGAAAVGCLLTGMGRDGASGLLRIRAGGGRTIAQDEATSVVYGMPREAARLGAAERVLPLPEIGPAMMHMIAARGGPS